MKTVSCIEFVAPSLIAKAKAINKKLSIESIHNKIELFFKQYPIEKFIDDSQDRIPIKVSLLNKKWLKFLRN